MNHPCVWLTIPSARPIADVAAVVKLWRAQGYNIALWRDEAVATAGLCDELLVGPYPGYARAVNALIKHVMEIHPEAGWFIAGGDDTLPDPGNDALTIAAECVAHFGGLDLDMVRRGYLGSTFGIMQPTGDRWGDARGAYIDRVAGSPWIGREFARRAYKGNGPLWHEYFHMGVDEELRAVAVKLGIYWERPDLTQHHQHWGRPKPGQRFGLASNMPDFLRRANSAEEWNRYKRLIAERSAAGFPGSELLG